MGGREQQGAIERTHSKIEGRRKGGDTMIYTEHLCTRPLYDALDFAELCALHEVGMMQPIMMPLPPACLTYNQPYIQPSITQ